MLLDRLEARVQAPHLQAFSIAVEDLERLRSGLRAALEQGDLSLLRTLWADRSPAYDQRATRRRWRVPGATISTVTALLAAKAATLLDDAPSLRERLLHALAELEARVDDQEHVDVAPEPWFDFEASSWSLIVRASENQWLASYDAERAVEALDQFFAPPISRPRRGPMGDLGWVRDLRFFLEDSQREVSWERVENHMRDTARYPHPSGMGALVSGTPYGAAMAVDATVNFDTIVSIAVGPYAESRGPAIYCSLPASEPLVASSSERLPLFRIDVPVPGSNWQVLHGDQLAEAAAKVRRTQSRARSGEGGRGSNEHELFAWCRRDEVEDEHVFFRDRFADLLEESAAANRAVLASVYAPDDQSELRPPATRAWGSPVSV